MLISKLRLGLSLVAIAVFAAATAAQTTRTYVAANTGSDANLCTSASPCKTVNQALATVDAGGEVILAETGDYAPFFIAKSVTVAAADGVNAGVVSSGGGSGIFIANTLQPTDVVALRNLHVIGAGAPQASDGVIDSFAGQLSVDNCVFTGLNNAVTMSNIAGRLYVHNSIFRNNLFGVGVIGPSGEGIARATIDNCDFESDDTGALFTNKVIAAVRNSVFAGNTSRAIQIRTTTLRWTTEANIENCQLSHNTVGVLVGTSNGGYAVARLSRSTITDNLLAGVSMGANSVVYTLGTNTITGNPTDVNGGSLTALAAK